MLRCLGTLILQFATVLQHQLTPGPLPEFTFATSLRQVCWFVTRSPGLAAIKDLVSQTDPASTFPGTPLPGARPAVQARGTFHSTEMGPCKRMAVVRARTAPHSRVCLPDLGRLPFTPGGQEDMGHTTGAQGSDSALSWRARRDAQRSASRCHQPPGGGRQEPRVEAKK